MTVDTEDPTREAIVALHDAGTAIEWAATLIRQHWPEETAAHPLPTRTARLLDKLHLRLEAEIRLLVAGGHVPDLIQEAADAAREQRAVEHSQPGGVWHLLRWRNHLNRSHMAGGAA